MIFSRLFCAFCAFSRRFPFLLSVFCFLLFVGALLWARGRDPFERRWFTVTLAGHPQAHCVAILPKTAPRPLPTVIYQPGPGATLLGSGNDLRQLAEMGLAVVGVDYCQTNEPIAQAQFAALSRYLQRQPWADTNRMIRVVAREGELQVESFRFQVEPTNAVGPTLAGSGTGHSSNGEELRTKVPPVQPVTCNLHPGTFSLRDGDRLATFRRVGESCLLQLGGPDALERYQSISDWQAQAKPLWLYWTPALAWAAFACRRRRQESFGYLRLALCNLRFTPWSCTAMAMAAAALGVTAVHLLTPRLPVSELTLGVARRFLLRNQERPDFEWLVRQGNWQNEKLGTLLEHVQLANYNRELVNWKVDPELYRRYVLWPQIQAEQPTPFPNPQSALLTHNWRRVLWESFYPRIRKEESPEAAADIVGRYLRERLTVLRKTQTNTDSPPRKSKPGTRTISETWRRQLSDEPGFERLSVAALRAVGLPARLNASGHAEFWTGDKWTAAPSPSVLTPPSAH